MKAIYTITLLLISLTIFSQKGKNGTLSVSTSTVKINEFTALTANASSGNTTINVAASSLNTNSRFTSTLTAGDLIMIIQMQGASTKTAFTPSYAKDSTYGYVWNYATCGNYEFAEVKSIISATQIELTCGLNYTYSSAGKTQIVRVPRYTSLSVIGTATLTSDPWNGTIGGVLIAEVNLNTIIDGVISANGLGFRGGIAIGNGGSGDASWGTKNINYGAEKGEGIGSDRLNNLAATDDSLGKQCKGAPGNGGGAGNANNCGGGGGANGGAIANYNGYGVINGSGFTAIWNLEWPGRATVTSSGGGKGGYGTATTTSPSVNSVGPNNTAWGSFKRPNYGGFGGRPLDYSTGKLFIGGGGGAGHMSVGQSNGANACSGGAGGGLIFLLNYGTISGSGTIIANGGNGNNAYGAGTFGNPTQGIDGGGGAGAGGTIILQSNGIISGITTSAIGGNGGNQVKSGTLNSEGQGPGGGGSGGYIAATNIGFTQNVNGGVNGTTNASAFDTEFPMNGATAGDVGTNNQVITPSFSLTASANQTLCTNQSAILTATSTNGAATVLWYNAAAGGNSIASGTTYTTPVYASTGTYTVYAGSCPGIYRVPIIITVGAGATFAINSPTICSGQTTVLTVTTAATSYTWNTAGSPTTSTLSVSPTSSTIYTINGGSGACVGSQTTQVTVNNTPTVSVTSVSICAGNSSTLTASGATNYTWMPGAQTTTVVVVTPTINITYTITGANGSCTGTTTAVVSVIANPTVAVSNQTICPTQTITLTANGATTYSWNTGPTTNTISVSPASTTIYTVVGTTSSCSNTKTVSVTLAALPIITVASTSICSGNSTTLTASGASNYTWAPSGQLTSTVSVNPSSNSTYTITGSNGTCTNSTTATVSVTANPTVAVSNQTICPTQTITLTANGATTYSWNTGPTTNTISVSPASTTIYTVVGTTSSCSDTKTVSVTVASQPTLAITGNTNICSGNSTTLTASGSASSYTWQAGAVVSNTISVNPNTTTTYTIIASNGTCANSTTSTVSVTATPTITGVANTTICPTQTITFTAGGAISYTWQPNNFVGTTYTIAPASNTTVSVTGANGACTTTETISVTIGTGISISVNNPTICIGETATLTASGGATSYTWSSGTPNTNTLSVSPSSTTTYTVLGTNGTCTGSNTAVVTVNSVPSVSVTSSTICSGSSTTLTASGAINYTWMPGGQLTSTITDNPTSSTIYTVTGSNGTCTNTANGTISVTPNPTITVNTATICAGQTATLTANGATTYTWNPGNLTTSSIVVTPSITTTYTISGTISTCSSSVTSIVMVNNCNNVCSFNLGRDTAFCSPLNYTINGPLGYTSYSWSPSGATTQNITATTSGTYICNASVLSNNLITNGDFSAGDTGFSTSYILGPGGTYGPISNAGTYSITNNPNSAHSNFYSFGDHTSGSGNMMAVNGSSVANTVVWSQVISITPNTNYNFSAWVASVENTSATDVAQLQFSINGSLVGSVVNAPLIGGVWANFFTNWNSGVNTSATIRIIDQNTSGNNDFVLDDIFYQQVCSYADTIIVTENPLPTVTAIASNSVICNGNSTSLTASGASTYTWTGGVTNGTSFSPTVTATYSVIGTSAAGCTNTAVQSVTVNSIPTVSVTNGNICSGQTATLVATGATTYTWSNSATGSSQTVSPVLTTTYSVSGTDINGCVSSAASTTVGVSATPTIAINSASICNGQTATLTATGATNYTWSTTQNTATVNVSPIFTTTYSVVGNNGGCSSSSTATVTVDPVSHSTFTIAVSTCPNETVTLYGAGTNSASTTYTWSNGVNSYSQTVNPSNTTTYIVNGTSFSGCPAVTGTFVINVNPISANFSGLNSNIVNVGETLNLTNTSTGATSILWDYCDGTSTSNQITIPLNDTGSCCIKLVATNLTCKDSITKCVTIVKEAVVIIPNVFTPNGDHANDVFRVSSNGLKSLNCTIFDRWGLKMYEWDGINGYWDGTVKSGSAPDGTYFYIINYTDQLDKTTTEKGFLNLFQN